MAGPYDEWRNTYGMQPGAPPEMRASSAPYWEELLRGSDVSAINQSLVMQAIGRFLSRPGMSETPRLSPIDGRPMAPEPTTLDNLPPAAREGINGLGILAALLGGRARAHLPSAANTNPGSGVPLPVAGRTGNFDLVSAPRAMTPANKGTYDIYEPPPPTLTSYGIRQQIDRRTGKNVIPFKPQD